MYSGKALPAWLPFHQMVSCWGMVLAAHEAVQAELIYQKQGQIRTCVETNSKDLAFSLLPLYQFICDRRHPLL